MTFRSRHLAKAVSGIDVNLPSVGPQDPHRSSLLQSVLRFVRNPESPRGKFPRLWDIEDSAARLRGDEQIARSGTSLFHGNADRCRVFQRS